MTGGTLPKVRRLEPGQNVRWEITVQPSSDADVTIVLPITTDCNAQGAICTSDGRTLSNRLEITVSNSPSGSEFRLIALLLEFQQYRRPNKFRPSYLGGSNEPPFLLP